MSDYFTPCCESEGTDVELRQQRTEDTELDSYTNQVSYSLGPLIQTTYLKLTKLILWGLLNLT